MYFFEFLVARVCFYVRLSFEKDGSEINSAEAWEIKCQDDTAMVLEHIHKFFDILPSEGQRLILLSVSRTWQLVSTQQHVLEVMMCNFWDLWGGQLLYHEPCAEVHTMRLRWIASRASFQKSCEWVTLEVNPLVLAKSSDAYNRPGW